MILNLKQKYHESRKATFIGLTSALAFVIIAFISSCTSKIAATIRGDAARPAKCAASSSRDGVCRIAVDLKWQEASPSDRETITAVWSKSDSEDLANQTIQFYSDDICQEVVGATIDLNSNKDQTYIFTASFGRDYTFKITSINTSKKEFESACSAFMTISAAQIATAAPNLPTSFVYQPTVRNLKFKLRTPAISPDTVGVHQTGSYAINPELPEGLAIDSTSGVISGRPLEKMELTNFTVTLSNSGGERQASLQISISDEYLDLSTISSTRDVNGIQTPMNLAFSAGFGGLTVVGDYLYMFGGAHDYRPWQNYTNRIQRAPLSDPTAWTGTGGLLPNRTAWVPAVTIDDKIFLYGNIYGTDQKSIFSANVATPDVWTDTGFDLPENSANHLIYVASDNVYILTANKIFVAPRTNPANMVDSGATNLPYFAHKNYIEFEDYLYVPEHTGGLVKRASKENPLVWETVCSDSTLAGGDNYTLTLVGSTVYYLGGHDYTSTWSAPIDALCNWTQSAYPIPQNSWGNSQAMRVGDFFYIFGGLNASYVGHEKITRAAIKVRYD